jgi:hypothetical protein
MNGESSTPDAPRPTLLNVWTFAGLLVAEIEASCKVGLEVRGEDEVEPIPLPRLDLQAEREERLRRIRHLAESLGKVLAIGAEELARPLPPGDAFDLAVIGDVAERAASNPESITAVDADRLRRAFRPDGGPQAQYVLLKAVEQSAAELLRAASILPPTALRRAGGSHSGSGRLALQVRRLESALNPLRKFGEFKIPCGSAFGTWVDRDIVAERANLERLDGILRLWSRRWGEDGGYQLSASQQEQDAFASHLDNLRQFLKPVGVLVVNEPVVVKPNEPCWPPLKPNESSFGPFWLHPSNRDANVSVLVDSNWNPADQEKPHSALDGYRQCAVKLNPKQYCILEALVASRGKLVRKHQIIEANSCGEFLGFDPKNWTREWKRVPEALKKAGVLRADDLFPKKDERGINIVWPMVS